MSNQPEIKRWRLAWTNLDGEHMKESNAGQYVLFSDHESILAEEKKKAEKLVEAIKNYTSFRSIYHPEGSEKECDKYCFCRLKEALAEAALKEYGA